MMFTHTKHPAYAWPQIGGSLYFRRDAFGLSIHANPLFDIDVMWSREKPCPPRGLYVTLSVAASTHELEWGPGGNDAAT